MLLYTFIDDSYIMVYDKSNNTEKPFIQHYIDISTLATFFPFLKQYLLDKIAININKTTEKLFQLIFYVCQF